MHRKRFLLMIFFWIMRHSKTNLGQLTNVCGKKDLQTSKLYCSLEYYKKLEFWSSTQYLKFSCYWNWKKHNVIHAWMKSFVIFSQILRLVHFKTSVDKLKNQYYTLHALHWLIFVDVTTSPKFSRHKNVKMGRQGGNNVGKSGREGCYSPPIDLYRRQVSTKCVLMSYWQKILEKMSSI